MAKRRLPAVRLLTGRQVQRLADVRMAIRVIESAFRALARGTASMPAKVYLPLPRQSDFRAMPAYVAHPPACGMKWVNVHPGNPRRGLPSVMAVIVINDPSTGVPLAILDGLLVTKLRTAAATAVATKTLARRESRIVALVGCGAQADAQLEALRHVMQVRDVRVWGYRTGEAAAFCRRLRRQMRGVRLMPVSTVQACVRGAHVIVTLTPARRPLLKRSWLAPGTHINAIGADAAGKQELEVQILRDAVVVVDEREQAIHGGELNVPIRRGHYAPHQIHASLGEILTGRRPGRRTPGELTVFDSTGLAIHDVALGAAILRRAERAKVGRTVDLCTA